MELTTQLKNILGPRSLLGALILVLVIWAYWSTLVDLRDRWEADPQYTQGYIIPVLAVGVLWLRRRSMPSAANFSWWGVLVVALGVGIRFLGTALFFEFVGVFSLIVILAGVVLCLGGPAMLRWSIPGFILLLFTVPIPFRVEMAVSGPLRGMSAQISTSVLQILGFPAVVEQNIVLVDEVTIGVVEACSGLGMIITMLALMTAVAMVCNWPWWQKGLVIASALPIAVVANILRITATGVLYETWGKGTSDIFYHDLAGWIMMPVALVFLWLELQVLERSFVDVEAFDSSAALKVAQNKGSPVLSKS